MDPSLNKGLNTYCFYYLVKQVLWHFNWGLKKSLDEITNDFIIFGLCLKISQIKFMTLLPRIEKKDEFKYQYSNQRENF